MDLGKLRVSSVTVDLNNLVREGYGVKITLVLPHSNFSLVGKENDKYSIDFHGNFWGGLPYGAKPLADIILPLKINSPVIWQTKNECRFSFILGAKGLSHKLLMDGLKKLIEKEGDPPIAMQINYESKDFQSGVLTQFVVKPSDMLRGIQPKKLGFYNILSSISPADIPRRTSMLSNAIRGIRWLFFPFLFIVLCWMNLYYSLPGNGINPLLLYTPEIITRLMQSNFSLDFHSVGKPYPTTLDTSFEVGFIKGQIESTVNATKIQDLLNSAANILNRSTISMDELKEIPEILQNVEHGRGLMTRFFGFFTFVNIIWLIAILGISISIGPSIIVLLRPIKHLFLKFSRWIYYEMVLPVAKFLHEKGILETAAWLFIFSLCLDSMRIVSNEVGFYVYLTSFALAAPCISYSTFLFGLWFIGKCKKTTISNLINTFVVLIAIPSAILFQSSILGFAAVFSIYSIIGFSVICRGLCYCIGFHSKEALVRVACASTILLTLFTIITIYYGELFYITPFKTAIGVAGGLTLYLALLIFSSIQYYSARNYPYYIRQIPMIVALTLGLLIGNMVLVNTGLANTATVFLVLFFIEKGADIHYHNEWNGWLLILFISVSTYYLALWFHHNPSIILSILQFNP